MSSSIHVIGLGVTEFAQLTHPAESALEDAQIVIGSERQLATVKRITGKSFNLLESIVLPPLGDLETLLAKHSDKCVAVLASGDRLYYGIGRWLSKRYQQGKLHFYPGVSSIQAACHSISLSLQDAEVISLHGRPIANLRRHLAQQQYLVILTDQHSTPQALAMECQQAGFDKSTIWVCEQLGYAAQKVRQFSVSQLLPDEQTEDAEPAFDPLHVTVIEVKGRTNYLPSFPGIPDANFITDAEAGKGLITKREVRLAILSLLQPAPQDIGWDIGAGCGGVAVEWALWNPLGQVHAIEHHAKRLDCLEQNRQRFGVVNNLKVVAGRAPEALPDLPAANKIFIGGSDGELSGLLRSLWANLPDGGVIVASAVMESTRTCLIQFAESLKTAQSQQSEVETLQIAVSRGGELAGQLLYRPALPVTLFKFIKHSTNHTAKGIDHDASK